MTDRQQLRGKDAMRAARSWAEAASVDELKAYALAAFEAMTPQDQAKFWFHISEVEF